MLRTVLIVAGHGAGLTSFKAEPFEVPASTWIHFLWKFGCTWNDPMTCWPKVIEGAIESDVRRTTTKDEQRYEDVYMTGTKVRDHVLTEIPTGERESSDYWDPDKCATMIKDSTKRGNEGDEWKTQEYIGGVPCEFNYVISGDGRPGKVQQFVIFSLAPGFRRSLRLSQLVKYVAYTKKTWGETDVYWWACRSPSYDKGDLGGLLYAAKWAFYGHAKAPL